MSYEHVHRWRQDVIGLMGPRDASTRHVLLTLSVLMGPQGTWSGVAEELVGPTGLSKRTVEEYLRRGEKAGWLERAERGSGKGWRTSSKADSRR